MVGLVCSVVFDGVFDCVFGFALTLDGIYLDEIIRFCCNHARMFGSTCIRVQLRMQRNLYLFRINKK